MIKARLTTVWKDLWDATRAADAEVEHLVLIPLAGHPEIVRERVASWVCLLHRASLAIGRHHRNLRLQAREVLIQILRASDVSVATTRKRRPQTRKVSPRRPLLFQSRRRHRLVRSS